MRPDEYTRFGQDPLRCGSNRIRAGASVPIRTRQFALVAVMSGCVHLHIRGEPRPRRVPAGWFFIRHPDLFHRTSYPEATRQRYLAVPRGAVEALAECGCNVLDRISGPLPTGGELMDRWDHLAQDIEEVPPNQRARFLPRSLALMIDLLADAEADREQRKWDTACRLLAREPAKSLQLEQVATAVDMHPTTFRIAFKKRYGIPPMTWRQQRRLEQAGERLLAGLSVRAVTEEFAFYDAFAFSRFKTHMGCSPSQCIGRRSWRRSPSCRVVILGGDSWSRAPVVRRR